MFVRGYKFLFVHSSPGFKYPAYNNTRKGFARHRHYHISVFDTFSCPLCFNYYNKSVYTFFSDRKREHYDQLYNNIFKWLDNLQINFFYDENTHYILDKIQVEMGKDSVFYDDARRHMPKSMRRNIESLEKDMDAYNAYVQTSNVAIDNRIKEIVTRPIDTKLTDEQISTIYRLVKTGFSQAIKGEQEVLTFIKNWDLVAKLKSHGFTTQQEFDSASNILRTIQQDQIIVEHVKQVQSNLIGLRTKSEVVMKQSRGISSRIVSHRYTAHHRCCPSLIKEMWHTLF
jgi:hypothetical protein